MTSRYTHHNLVIPWDFIANIDQQQNIGQGKSYWPSGPYTNFSTQPKFPERLADCSETVNCISETLSTSGMHHQLQPA